MDLASALTEQANPDSQGLDCLSALDIVKLMNRQDTLVVDAVERALPSIARLVEGTAQRLGRGGRLFYVGAGTSGRLGMLDAAECPPTFGTSPELVQAVLAGGSQAFLKAVEHAEDQPEAGAAELLARGLGADDVVVGISASGRTPFVLGALAEAQRAGALTGSMFCNPDAPMAHAAEVPILLKVGPEILAGSTRLKAGTATKMALNMLSTAVMVRLGRTMGNLMADLTPTCEKLRQRSIRILCQSSGLDSASAQKLYEDNDGDLRRALELARSGAAG
jgi:N-acetylmuramic acid 6-phosphate etherase